MKKLFVFVLTMGMLAGTIIASETTVSSSQFNEKLKNELKTAGKMSERYKKNADIAKKKGNIELSQAYQACSDAKGKITVSLEGYLKAVDNACKIADGEKKLTPLVSSTLIYDKKGERLSSRIKKLQSCEEMNKDNSEFKTALNDMINGLQEYSKANKEFKESNVKLKALKKNKDLN